MALGAELLRFAAERLKHGLVRLARRQVSVDVLHHREGGVAKDMTQHDRGHPSAERPGRVRVPHQMWIDPFGNAACWAPFAARPSFEADEDAITRHVAR